MLRPIAALLLVAQAAAVSVSLSTGELHFDGDSPAAGAFPGLFVLSIEPTLLGGAHAAVTALGCSAVHSFLPPSALLVHIPTPACHARALALPHVAAAAALPPHLKYPPAVLTSEGQWAPQAPVRALRLQLAAGGLEGLAAFLAPQLAALCPTCTLHAASSDGGHALLTSLSSCPRAARCTFESPAACGCTIPPSLLRLLASYHALLYAEAAEPPAKAYNAFQREITLTADLLNSPTIAQEFGACADTGSCELSRFIPLSQAGAFLENPTAAAALAGPAGRAAAAARGAAAAAKAKAAAAPLPLGQPRPQPAGVVSPAAPAAAAAATGAAVVVAAAELAAVAAQQEEIWGPARRGGQAAAAATAARALQGGTCSVACSSPSCGQGFASCNDLETYVGATLTGAGQLIHVLDSGLDFGSPFFLDARAPSATGFAPSRTLPMRVSSHTHVPSYFSFVDGLDDERGHGTHVAGSVAGSAVDPTLLPSDASALQPHHGAAPRARILFTDASCTAAPGDDCPMTGNVYPWGGGFAPCPQGPICAPLDWNVTFGAPRAAGAFVSGNSWGASSQSQYNSNTAALDAWVFANPDFLPVFAASNDGSSGFLSLGAQATAKNVLTVGATNDGPIAHLAKIANFFQGPSIRGCTSMLTGALQQGLVPGPAPCPATITPDTCSRLADASQRRVLNVPPDRFNETGNIELALCCGCTPADVLAGYSARADGGEVAAQFGFLSTALTYLGTYQGRLRASFSSLGPTQDGRIKPDVTCPGMDIVSANGRGSGVLRGTADPPPYGTFTCPSTPTTVGATPWPGQQVLSITAPAAGLEVVLAAFSLDVVEPMRLVNISLPFQSLTAGTYVLEILYFNRDVGGYFSLLAPLRFTTATGFATPGSILFPDVNMEMSAGLEGLVLLRATAGSVLTTYATATAADAEATCWGRLGTSVLLTITSQRGGGLGYTATTSGTSMATPHVTGLAGLVREYYTGGRYMSMAFTPSAALLKGTLINSASPLIYEALNIVAPFFFPPASAALQFSSGGFGVPNLVRGLQFPSLGSATSASRVLPTLLLPGLTVAGGAGVDPALASGASHTYCIDVSPRAAGLAAGAGLPFSLTLTWTDPPGNPLASWMLVNNLDLALLPPGGAFTIYGNNNASSPTQIPDGRNNVEKIELRSPPPTLNADGSRASAPYAVTVRGSAVPLGPTQAYSLVVTGPGLALAAAGSCSAGGGGGGGGAAAAAASAALPTPAAAAIAVLTLLVVALGVAVAVLLWKQRAATQAGAKPQAWASGSPAAPASQIKLNPVAQFGAGAP